MSTPFIADAVGKHRVFKGDKHADVAGRGIDGSEKCDGNDNPNDGGLREG